MQNAVADRIADFLEESRERGSHPPASPKMANFTKAFFGPFREEPYWKRYALSLGHAIESEPVYTFDGQRLAGMLYQTSGATGNVAEFEAKLAPYRVDLAVRRLSAEAGIDLPFSPYAAPGHIGWRWDRVLALGIDRIIEDLKKRLAAAPDEKAAHLYEGGLILWQSVLRWNDRHIDDLKARNSEHSEILGVCSRVPRLPTRTFHEAVQSFYMQYLAVMFENPFGGNGPGRLDYFLWPYLERDLERGQTTLREARGLVDELFIRLHERIQDADGWVEAIVVGGTHPDGASSLNPLTYMMIQSIIDLNQTHPSVYTRITAEDPDDFVNLNVEYLLKGGNRAQIYNDPACQSAMQKSGIAAEDAAMFMAGGCMEISSQGAASDMNFTGTINVAKILEYAINGGFDMLSGDEIIRDMDTLEQYDTFDELYAAFEGEISREFTEWVRALDIGSRAYADLRPCFLLSTLTDDCLEKGREQQDGGARYHEYGFSPLGLTAAADALYAIKAAVFDQRFVSAPTLLTALRSNYDGHEQLRLRLRNLPRYGAENPQADAMANRVLSSVCSIAAASKNRFGGALKPMLFSFVWIPASSSELGARADGQLAGERIGHGITPQALGMTHGISPALNSCVSLDYSVVNGGATTMWDLDPSWAGFDVVKSVLTRFLAGGGMIFQGNMTNVDDLQRALKDPENYANLIVRVGGYSARFTSLPTELQQEIVTRFRHAG